MNNKYEDRRCITQMQVLLNSLALSSINKETYEKISELFKEITIELENNIDGR